MRKDVTVKKITAKKNTANAIASVFNAIKVVGALTAITITVI